MDIIRRNTDYALRAVLILAQQYQSGHLPAATIARRQHVSVHLTSKLLQRLQQAGIVRSQMGAAGGFRLARDPSQISVLDVVEAIQGRLTLNRCLIARHLCPLNPDCPLWPVLARIEQILRDGLGNIRISELCLPVRGQTDEQ
ncbi:MAG: Rrf2 family transcriptional regulator [Sedimentisphaerales bacterium]|nr:Rrf2 family transcriptional regulator [Sedimentisphaerales bacterium]